MSQITEYSLPGATKAGVPQTVVFIEFSEILLVNPKSPIFNTSLLLFLVIKIYLFIFQPMSLHFQFLNPDV
jgi:hypothetical protein